MQRSLIDKSAAFSTKKDAHKALLELSDGNKIETVLIKHHGHFTACVSSQVGCPLACVFCATGQGGFLRNLEAAEIVGQINFWNEHLVQERNRVKNVVFMGMGEPFLNWDNIKMALRTINRIDGLNIGQRRITVSTCGIVDKIEEFSRENRQINLAISLHSAIDQTRSALMPINKKYPLKTLIAACLYYVAQTKRKLFFEYALLRGINDTDEEIRQLLKLIKKHYLFHLNLIPYNKTECDLKPSRAKRRHEIIRWLKNDKVAFTIRKSFGLDICAACGQLRLHVNISPPPIIPGKLP
jgi:23S rRNA (adenine2503-C2)-methyltransferase